MAEDVFGYIELTDADAVPKSALVHSFELRKQGEDLVPYMQLMGEEPSSPHIETLKTKQEKRRAERRVLTKGKNAVEADTPVIAEVPTSMEIPLYHFASDIETFLDNPNVVKAADVLPKESPLLRPRALSDADGAVEFALKSETPGLTFSRARAGFTDFFVGPVGDRDHRVALHGFLTRPLPIFIKGRGTVILQPGFEMVAVLKGRIVPGVSPKGKKVATRIPKELPAQTKFGSPAPIPGYFEPQDPKSLGCGRHALNNLLGGSYFVKDDEQEITESNIESLEIPVSMMSMCKYLVTKKQVLGSNPCPTNENYEDSVMMGALRVLGYSATPLILEEIQDTSVGFIANTGDHWVALRRNGDTYDLIDSLKEEKEEATETLAQIREKAQKGEYPSIIKVEFKGSFINPVPEEAPVATATDVVESVMESLVGPSTPASTLLPANADLTPEENEIGQQARTDSAVVAHKVAQGIPGGPVPVPTPVQETEEGEDEDALFGQQARTDSAAEARKAARGFSSVTIPTKSSTSSASASASVSTPKSKEETPKCLKVQGTVDEHFNENIHTAIREFIRTTKPGLLNAENEQKALQHQPLNSYLQEIQSEKSGKAYTLLLPTREGSRTQTNRSVEAYFTGWTVPADCTMGGDIVKISVNPDTGYAIVNPTVGGGAVTEWTYFKFELAYA
uniref:ubiquitinyl hydrolase 1 n=1 Tax=viral metagenome TaxID=1070528 RepID=A0A6C0CIM0_9ZZZZ